MLDKLFLQAPRAMLLIDPINNKILKVNHEASKLFGISPESIDRFTVTHYFSGCLEKLMNFTQQVFEQESAWSADLNIVVNNEKVQLEIHAKLIEGNVLLSCQDHGISFERHYQSVKEEQFQSGLPNWRNNDAIFEEIERKNNLLLTAVGDGIYGVDKHGRATFVNEAAEKIIGYSKAELSGQNIHEVIHHSHADGSHYQACDCPIFSAVHDGGVKHIDDEVFWAKNGKAIPVEYTSTPLRDNGIIIGAVVIFRDISERKQVQERLLNALEQVDSLKQRLELDNAYLKEELDADFNHHQIIGQSLNVQQMVQQIDLVGPSNANVLITGESGTGKELIARAIHEVSQRQARPLIRVNCAAIPTELFESEFFGHVKGAFSGAISDRMGRFELADGATIFLDEVGEIPLQLQGKLLRVLQEQQFERVGESKTRCVDVRVISATNQDLKALVKQNKFREDLYFRLNVFPVHSPALHERIEDIPLLVNHFVNKISKRANQQPARVPLTQLTYLQNYHWPGNIRELENIIERQLILAKGNKLNFEFLAKESSVQNWDNLQSIVNPVREDAKDQPIASKLMNAQQQKAFERENLITALKKCRGKVYGDDGAASLLGLKPTTLSSRLKKYGVIRQDYISNSDWY